MEIEAHAKLNLALAVGPPIPGPGPRAGYHPIASWMIGLGLCDHVEVTPARTTAFDIAWHDGRGVDWPIERDLAFRAHAAIEARVGRALPVRVTVRKRIPAGAGLGGGSSDAAAVMTAMVRVFGLDLGERALHAAAFELGSDVAFFVDPVRDPARPPRAAVVTGLGERVDRLEAGPGDGREVFLFFPPFGCPTGAVYRAFDARPPGRFREADVGELARAGSFASERLFNDLAAAAEQVEPRLGVLRRALAARLGTPVHVTGSGSTLFAVPAEGAEADALRALARDAAGEVGVAFLATRMG